MTEKHVQISDLNEVIQTLEKSPLDRNPRELDRIRKQTQEISFFKKYINEGHRDVHEKCCKFMKVEHFENAQPVFLIDTVGSKFYLILSGKVGVYIRLPSQKDQISNETPEKQQPPPLTCVKELHAGEAFGELALLNNKPRLASIIAHESIVVAVLEKKDFMLILKEKEEQKLLKEMGFFARLPFFEGWNFNLVKLLYLNVFRVKYHKKDFVFQEGQEPLAVFIVTQGQFDIEKTFEKEDKVRSWQNPIERELDQLKISNKKTSVVLRLTSYDSQELFGEEDIMNHSSKRTFSAVCSSATGECIMIKKQDFFLRILKEEGAGQYLRNRLESKNQVIQMKTDKIKEQIHGFKNYFYRDQEKIKHDRVASLAILKNEQISDHISEQYLKKSDENNRSSNDSSRATSPLRQHQQQLLPPHSPLKSHYFSPSKCLSPIASSSMILFQPKDSHSDQHIVSRVLKTYQDFPSLRELSKTTKSRPKTPPDLHSSSQSNLHSFKHSSQFQGLLQDKSNNSRNVLERSPTAVISLKIPSKMRLSLPTNQLREFKDSESFSQQFDQEEQQLKKKVKLSKIIVSRNTKESRELVTKSSLSYLDESGFVEGCKHKREEQEKSTESGNNMDESGGIAMGTKQFKNRRQNTNDGSSSILSKVNVSQTMDSMGQMSPFGRKDKNDKEDIGNGASPIIPRKYQIFLNLKSRSLSRLSQIGQASQQQQSPFCIQLLPTQESEHDNYHQIQNEEAQEAGQLNEFINPQKSCQIKDILQEPLQCSVKEGIAENRSMISTDPSSDLCQFNDSSPKRIAKSNQAQLKELIPFRTNSDNSAELNSPIKTKKGFHQPQSVKSNRTTTLYFNSVLLQKSSPTSNQQEDKASIKKSSLSFSKTMSTMKLIRFRKSNGQSGNMSSEQIQKPQETIPKLQLSTSPTNNPRGSYLNQQNPEIQQIEPVRLSSQPHRHLKGSVSSQSDLCSSTQDEIRWRQLLDKQHLSPSLLLNNILERRQEQQQQKQFKIQKTSNNRFSNSLSTSQTQSALSSSVLDNLKGQLSIGTQFSSILKQIGTASSPSSAFYQLNILNKNKV